MLAKVRSQAVLGVDGHPIEVEVHVSSGKELFSMVGLPDAAVKESKDRVKGALLTSGFHYPREHITVNLAPADMRKEGPSLDLPIALGLLAATGRVDTARLPEGVVVGELSLDGAVRAVSGTLAMTLGARAAGMSRILVPTGNAEEAALVQGIDVVPIRSLAEAVAFLNGTLAITPVSGNPSGLLKSRLGEEAAAGVDFAEVRGQHNAKRALEIAAAGGHNALLVGPPGSGKTMLAKRLPTILPQLTIEESIEATKVHSVAGLVGNRKAIVAQRPFRAPHHTASTIALVGGGGIPRPGEVSLAHHGVLFLDEMPEFARPVLEALRQPLEDGKVTISRASMTLTFPARFILIGSMNPCPCGYATDPARQCLCSPQQVQKYMSRLSGPLMDRIDLHIDVPAVPVRELAQPDAASNGTANAERSDSIRRRVEAARAIQRERYAKLPDVHCNAHLTGRDVRRFCGLGAEAQSTLVRALDLLGFSARAYDRILKTGRTIADLAGDDEILADHIAEAISFRTLDRNAPAGSAF